MLKHGHAKNGNELPEYRSWVEMRRRCNCPTDAAWKWYGGRGITICERWNDFAAFLADMGPRPSPKHGIDRIDNDGPYCPANCRWALAKEQARNRRNNRVLTFNGETRCLTEWSEVTGIKYATLQDRLDRAGWSVADALTLPPDRSRRMA